MNADDDVIKVTVDETEEYFLDSIEADPRQTTTSRMLICAVAITAGISTCAVLGYLDYRKHDPLWWISIPIGIFIIGFVLYQQTKTGRRRAAKRTAQKMAANPPNQCSHEFRLEGVVAGGTAGVSTFRPWEAIVKVVQREDGLIFYINKQFYFWVPAKAFKNEQDYLKLLELIAAKTTSFVPLKG